MNAPGVRVRRNWKWASTGTRRGPDFEETNCAFHPTLRRRASSTAYSAAWTACPARTSIIAGPRNAPSASRCSPSADTRYVHLFRLIFRTTVQCPTTVSSAYQIITRWIFLKKYFFAIFLFGLLLYIPTKYNFPLFTSFFVLFVDLFTE